MAHGEGGRGWLERARQCFRGGERWSLARVPDEPHQRRQGRVIVRSMALLFAIVLGWMPLEVQVNQLRDLPVALVLAAGIAVSLLVLRRTGQVVTAAHLVAATVVSTVLLSARIEFGGAGLPALGALVLVPLVTAACGGVRAGITWAGVSSAVLVGQVLLDFAGRAPARNADAGRTQVLWFVTDLAVLFAATGLMVLFERSHAKTRRELEQALARARAADRVKTEFLACMSHELRTPLNGVLGSLSLLDPARLPTADRELVALAHSSGEQLLALVNDVLDYAQVESARVTPNPVIVTLEQLAHGIREAHGPAAEAQRLSFEVAVEPGALPAVRCDAHQIHEVARRLVGNAVKFTARGRVSVRLGARAEGPSARLTLRVEDTGVGVVPELREAIFAPFVQGDGSSTRRHGGVGLGLTIARRIVERLGGAIEVESRVGEGSVFTASMLVATPEGRVVRAAPSAPRVSGRAGALGGA